MSQDEIDAELKRILKRMWNHIFDSFTDIYYGEPEETMWLKPIKTLIKEAEQKGYERGYLDGEDATKKQLLKEPLL